MKSVAAAGTDKSRDVGNSAGVIGDYQHMRCEDCREAISASIDGEMAPFSPAEVATHLVGCPACRGFGDDARELHRRVRVRRADDIPDLTNLVLARAGDLMPTPLGDAAISVRSVRRLRWARLGLACLGLLQLGVSVPALFFGADRGAPLHVAHEIGVWGAALAVAMVFVAFQPRRAAGLLPFAAVVSAGLVITSVIDVARGYALSVNELVHLVALVGAVLVWLLARGSGDTDIAPHSVSSGQRAA